MTPARKNIQRFQRTGEVISQECALWSSLDLDKNPLGMSDQVPDMTVGPSLRFDEFRVGKENVLPRKSVRCILIAVSRIAFLRRGPGGAVGNAKQCDKRLLKGISFTGDYHAAFAVRERCWYKTFDKS